ncbi:ATPase PAAT isoform X2 [Scomber japonicus]|uniref:ATPase PAAT isoform X2 n=1 Tax=Scomber japonicus TaxID=13676 RepID=UPI0023061625|nr:ATPase PAAT isoform X2 [Scomber japonicus]
MVDICVKSGAAWVCNSPERHLSDVLLPVYNGNKDNDDEGEETHRGDPVLLEQTEEGSPCVLMLHCSPGSPAVISRLLLVSEARTMEVYDQTGEYCGTVRGERDDSIQPDCADRGPFYRKQLILDDPSSACEVKLLSLAGRSSVLVCQVLVGLQQLQPAPARGPGINMQQVQSLVDEMGTSLSPGAQNLMEMVHIQQKNQTSSLDGLLPLLMGGGAFSALTRGATAALRNEPQPADFRPPVSPAQNGAASDSSTSSSSPSEMSLSSVSSRNTTGSESRSPVSHSQLTEMMSHFLNGHGQASSSGPGPDFLPMLQSVCGQVTQLRLDDAAAEREKAMRNGSWELDAAMERRLEEMEKRLKEHMDRRLDALEQKLEKALLSALPLVALNQAAVGGSAGGGSYTRPSDGADRTNACYALTSCDHSKL